MISTTKGFSMKYLFLAVATCSLLWVAAGCSQETISKVIKRRAPEEEQALAVAAIKAIHSGSAQEARALMSPQCNQATSDADLQELKEQIADINPAGGILVGYSSQKKLGDGGHSYAKLDYEYKLNEGLYRILMVQLDTSSKPYTLQACNVMTSKVSVLATLSFSLKNKPAINQIMLILAISIPLFCLFALVQCIRTKVKRKWLWILFILFAFGSVSLNWSTSDLRIGLLNFQLLGSGLRGQGMGGPRVLTVAFPLGAIWFLLKRKALTLAPTPKETPSDTEL